MAPVAGAVRVKLLKILALMDSNHAGEAAAAARKAKEFADRLGGWDAVIAAPSRVGRKRATPDPQKMAIDCEIARYRAMWVLSRPDLLDRMQASFLAKLLMQLHGGRPPSPLQDRLLTEIVEYLVEAGAA
jgi:hypothetical protein